MIDRLVICWLLGFAFFIGYEVAARAERDERPSAVGYDAWFVFGLTFWPVLVLIHAVRYLADRAAERHR